MAGITLRQYQEEERRLAADEARRGLRFHVLVTVLVIIVLVAVNVAVGGFPWSAFAAFGMLVGVAFHAYFGVVHGDEAMQQHQAEVERHAGWPKAA